MLPLGLGLNLIMCALILCRNDLYARALNILFGLIYKFTHFEHLKSFQRMLLVNFFN